MRDWMRCSQAGMIDWTSTWISALKTIFEGESPGEAVSGLHLHRHCRTINNQVEGAMSDIQLRSRSGPVRAQLSKPPSNKGEHRSPRSICWLRDDSSLASENALGATVGLGLTFGTKRNEVVSG